MENMPFPSFSGQTNTREMFQAIRSVRKLLNSIHHTLYASSRTATIAASQSSPHSNSLNLSSPSFSRSSLENVCSELEVWYQTLPNSIRPDLSKDPRDLQDAWLRLQYWSAKHIIYRPCLIHAASMSDAQDLPAFVKESSEKCINACRSSINTASYVLVQRTHYTWMTIQA